MNVDRFKAFVDYKTPWGCYYIGSPEQQQGLGRRFFLRSRRQQQIIEYNKRCAVEDANARLVADVDVLPPITTQSAIEFSKIVTSIEAEEDYLQTLCNVDEGQCSEIHFGGFLDGMKASHQ
ncbi:hypothetical protein CkaCkLH20_05185 [Colletotrichum karsti]|uniref:Uncharacterized protein n=1 Tax=Colletotrichum karsti TaxID=1095194 RepID=A0A9P6LLQ2_9PEZI|nr:uncharacterized protein CkaCkLH20_05185 [Colletotrichum karsti]KAF9877485.1 hypothetical protein CkaCkLH20_05185 [Colletotrichum karsti]